VVPTAADGAIRYAPTVIQSPGAGIAHADASATHRCPDRRAGARP
jgi:D-serine deaminase-like pyridoxal phosphate-dependent protein